MRGIKKYSEYMAQVLVISPERETWVNYEIRVSLTSLLRICVEEIIDQEFRIIGFNPKNEKWFLVMSNRYEEIIQSPLLFKRANFASEVNTMLEAIS